MSRLTARGIGHSNIVLERDYKEDKGWCVRVETEVPINNEPQIRAWLDKSQQGDIEALVNSVIAQVPDKGGLFGARHMIAAAFGYELGDNGTSITKRNPDVAASKPSRNADARA